MTDVDQRYFLNPEAVSRHLFCSVCQEVFKDPQRAPCGHSFCKQCIKRWLQQSKTCPEDRRPLQMKELHYDFILANIISDQMVACPYRAKGCEYINKLETLASHKKSCTFNPSNLPQFLKDEDENKSRLGDISNLSTCFDDTEKLPTPAKPSLKMRLFCDANKRDLLCSVFDGKENKDAGKPGTDHQWLTRDVKVAPNKRRKVVTLDDSFD